MEFPETRGVAASGEYLTFTLGAEEYGIDILKVQEIRGYEAVTRIANAPPFIKGVINLRGVKESGNIFAIPTYFFLVTIGITLVVGFLKMATGTLGTVAGVEGTAVVLDSALGAGYAAATSVLALLENVAYFRDGTTRILRRRVNASPAQPLLDDTASVSWSHDPEARLVTIRVEIAAEGAHPYGTTVFLKNPALAHSF